MAKTPDLDLYFLARNVRWRYQLDQYEDAALKELLGYYDGARKTLERRIESFAPDMKKGRFTRDRVEALLDEVYAVSGTIRKKIGEDVSTIAAAAGEASFKEHSDILSLGGMLTPFNAVAVGAEQIKALLVKTPIGGRNLQGWIDKTFDDATRAGIKAEVAQGMILGEGYPALVKRLSTGFDIARREAITIARTYVQNVNVSAQEAVYKANKNIVKAVEWSSVLEPGYAKTGRGTCLRCAALDGRKWKIDEEHPQIPLHPRCRCVLLPVTKTWKELGVDLDELEDVERAATIVDDKNIDAGGRRTIREVGFHKGTYSTWFEGQSPRFQKNVLGPGRYHLFSTGKASFDDFVDGNGNLRLIDFDRNHVPVGLKPGSDPTPSPAGGAPVAPVAPVGSQEAPPTKKKPPSIVEVEEMAASAAVIGLPQAEATAAIAAAKDAIDSYWKGENFIQVGPQQGSNKGGLFQNRVTGEKWYVKIAKDEDHARNEILAGALYRKMGIEVPETRLLDIDGRKAVASRWIEGLEDFDRHNKAHIKAAWKGFGADAFLANWDVVGMDFDNLKIKDGVVYRVDPGGALLFRAQGAPKLAYGGTIPAIGHKVSELKTLRDPGINKTANAVFGKMGDKDVYAALAPVAVLTKEEIAAAFKFAGIDLDEKTPFHQLYVDLNNRIKDAKAQRDEIKAAIAAKRREARQRRKAAKAEEAAPKAATAGVAKIFRNKKVQDLYEAEYRKALSMSAKEMKTAFRLAIKPDIAKALDSWQGSAQNEGPVAFKAFVKELEDRPSVVKNYPGYSRAYLQERAKGFSIEGYARLRAMTQAYYDMPPEVRKTRAVPGFCEKGEIYGYDEDKKTLRLFRGIDRTEGEGYAAMCDSAAARAIKAGKDWREVEVEISETAVVGWTRNIAVADNFGSAYGGITIRQEIPTKKIVLSRDIWDSKRYTREDEHLVEGPEKAKIKLKDIKWPGRKALEAWSKSWPKDPKPYVDFGT